MSVPKRSKSQTFLLELLIMILLFSLAAVICVRIFVKAYQMNRESERLTQAVTLVRSLEAVLRSDGACGETMLAYWPEGSLEDQTYTLDLTQDWEPGTEADAAYVLQIDFTESDGLEHAGIRITLADDGEEILSTQLDHHTPQIWEEASDP